MTGSEFVLVACDRTPELDHLVAEIAVAARRSIKADPGDRADITRFESLSVKLEHLVERRARAIGQVHPFVGWHAMAAPGVSFDHCEFEPPYGTRLADRLPEEAATIADRLVSNRQLVVAIPASPLGKRIVLPAPGFGSRLPEASAPVPREIWRSERGARGKRAVIERFERQVAATLDPDGAVPQAITPSGIHNQVLAEVLRSFVVGTSAEAVRVPVAYKDGSEASYPFPLRCLNLVDDDCPSELQLDLALMSIRHTDMDSRVHGAWLRNSDVSRPRPAGETDDYVYETSRAQLDQLTISGRRTVAVRIFQTGLETAVVGFYRAIVEHLLVHPATVTVTPMYYVDGADTPDGHFVTGTRWTSAHAPGAS